MKTQGHTLKILLLFLRPQLELKLQELISCAGVSASASWQQFRYLQTQKYARVCSHLVRAVLHGC